MNPLYEQLSNFQVPESGSFKLAATFFYLSAPKKAWNLHVGAHLVFKATKSYILRILADKKDPTEDCKCAFWTLKEFIEFVIG